MGAIAPIFTHISEHAGLEIPWGFESGVLRNVGKDDTRVLRLSH